MSGPEYKWRFEAVFPFDVPDQCDAARLVASLVARAGMATERCKLNDADVEVRALADEVRNTGRPVFRLSFAEASSQLGRVRNFNHAFLQLETNAQLGWRGVVQALAGLGPLVSARVAIREYEYWQNAEDPLLYRAAGRRMDGLPMKSNGLPPPLDQEVVDTSRNPGRRELRRGFVEAIGHRMWLGPLFWERTGASRQDVLSAPWLQVEELAGDILEITAQDAPFQATSDAEPQDRLRSLLFPGA